MSEFHHELVSYATFLEYRAARLRAPVLDEAAMPQVVDTATVPDPVNAGEKMAPADSRPALSDR
jgi:hypothetical protein